MSAQWQTDLADSWSGENCIQVNNKSFMRRLPSMRLDWKRFTTQCRYTVFKIRNLKITQFLYFVTNRLVRVSWTLACCKKLSTVDLCNSQCKFSRLSSPVCYKNKQLYIKYEASKVRKPRVWRESKRYWRQTRSCQWLVRSQWTRCPYQPVLTRPHTPPPCTWTRDSCRSAAASPPPG